VTRGVLARGRDGEPIWIDLVDPGPDELAAAARELGMDPPAHDAGDDATLPRLRRAPVGVSLALVGVSPDERLREVRCHVAGGRLLTVRAAAGPSLDGLDPSPGPSTAGRALAVLVDRLVTSLVEHTDDVAAAVGDLGLGRDRGDLARIRRALSSLRRVVVLQQDVIGRLASEDDVVDDAAARHLRDAYGRMGQLGTELEATREALHDAAADRENDVVRRLTLIAVIFLPLTFLTGFFGQNFPWLVEHIGGVWWFVALGLVLPTLAVGALLLVLRRSGWV